MKRYLIALALALGIVVASVATATATPYQEFKQTRIKIHTAVDTAKQNRCRGHAAPFKFRAYQILARLRPATLRFWRERRAIARSRTSLCSVVPAWITSAFLCIKSHEGAWTSNTGNGYYGGLQMDMSFQATYGGEFLRRYGTADHWLPFQQIFVGYQAWKTRGFYPWPNTARMCGLI